MAKAAKTKSAYRRKTWQEKMLKDKAPVVKKTDRDFADIPAGSAMLIATPAIVDAYIRQIPRGHFTTIKQIRGDLAAAYNAAYTCPVTTGIFLRMVAEAAYEEYEKGKALGRITPFWRALSLRSPSAKKLRFGIGFLAEQQKKEGIIS